MQTKVEEEAFDAAVASLQGAIALKADQTALDPRQTFDQCTGFPGFFPLFL
jgi:hypothetical protein